MHIFENDSTWKYNADNDADGSVLNDPVLKQRVIQATRRYVENMFDNETEDLQVSVVDVSEGIRYEPSHLEVKVVADFSIETEGESERTLNKVIWAINRGLERQLDGDGEGRYVTAKVSLSKISGRYFLHLEYVGPGTYDNVGQSFETRDDYFKALMGPIKRDVDLIYRVIGYYG